jgi:endonuclease IV
MEKMKHVHIHFSAIKFNEHGERHHTILSDPKFSFPFEPLGKLIKEHGLEPIIICESDEIMAQDAVRLLNKFNSL